MWLARWRGGDAVLADRRSVPHQRPHATRTELVELIRRLRDQRWTTPQLSWHLAMPLSTISAICRRLGRGRLGPATPPEPPRRYQRDQPGSLVHLDVKKLGRFATPGHRSTGDRRRGESPGAGWEYLHVATDDATRLAYVEVLDTGETGQATSGFVQRALTWFAARGVTVHDILTDNGPGYRSGLFRQVTTDHGLTHRRTRPYRPRTNGKAERFIRILPGDWAYRVTFANSPERRKALPAYLHYYNHHRPHGSLNQASPAHRLHTLNNPASTYG